MLISQLFIFALGFIGFGIYAILKQKKFVGWAFILLGLMLFIVAAVVVFYYPYTVPFKL